MTGLVSLQSPYLAQSPYPAPRANASLAQNQGKSGIAFSIDTDTSRVKGDSGRAANRSVAAAAGSALDRVDELTRFAKAVGGNPEHKRIAVFTADGRTGRILSEAALNGDGDLDVYGSGSFGGADSAVGLHISGNQSGSAEWSTRASSGLATAAYRLHSLLDQVESGASGASVNTSA